MSGTKLNNTSKFSVLDLSSVKVEHVKTSATAGAGKRDQTRANKESGERITSNQAQLIGVLLRSYQIGRLEIFERLLNEYNSSIAAKQSQSISITLPDGSVKQGFMMKTTPLDIAKEISTGLADSVIVAKVVYMNPSSRGDADDNIIACDEDDEAAAESEPLAGDCLLSLLKFDDAESKTVFSHSSAHILGAGTFGSYLTIGPPLQSGFYYDSYMGHHTVSEEDLKKNPFKVSLISNKIPDGGKTTVY
eukprot:gene27910-36769_t